MNFLHAGFAETCSIFDCFIERINRVYKMFGINSDFVDLSSKIPSYSSNTEPDKPW